MKKMRKTKRKRKSERMKRKPLRIVDKRKTAIRRRRNLKEV